MRKSILFLIITAAALLTSCPNPISETILNQAEDILTPRIVVASPGDNSAYNSTVEVTGAVTDDAIRSSDNQGVIQSFSYEILYDPDRRGGIVLAQGGSYQQDPSAGTGTILYASSTGEYTFSFSTVNPSILSGQVTLRITAVDSNGNTTIRDIKLLESGGLVITLEEPGTTITDFTDGTQVQILGRIANSNKDSGCEEIALIEWNANNVFRGSLDMTGADPDTNESPTGYFSSTTEPQGYTFTFDTRTGADLGCFESFFSTDDPDTDFYRIVLTARDLNGHETSEDLVIYRQSSGPSFEFSAATNDLANTRYLTNQNFDPFAVELNFSDYNQVDELSYQIRSSAGDSSLQEIQIDLLNHSSYTAFTTTNTFTFTPNGDRNGDGDVIDSGETNYAADISAWQDTTQTLILYITAIDSTGEPAIRTKRINLDSVDPAFTVDSISDTFLYGGSYYAQPGSKTFAFSYSDDNSGIDDTVDFVFRIDGTQQATLTPDLSGTGSFDYTVGAGGTDGETLTFSVEGADNAGNSGSASRDVVIYRNDPTVSAYAISAGGDSWAKSGETITLNFDCDHVITTTPSVSIGGTAGAAQAPSGGWDFTYTASLSGGTEIDSVPIIIGNITDAAGRSMVSSYTADTSLHYDPVDPDISAGNVALTPAAGATLTNGDTIRVDWDASAAGDDHDDIASVTVDFSDFGGPSAKAAAETSSGSRIWRAEHTISGSPANTSSAVISIASADHAGNTGSYSSGTYSIDTEGPTISPAYISVSGASAGSGVFVDGDTLTAQWNASGSGDDETDISSVTFDLSAFNSSASAVSASETTSGSRIWQASCAVNLGTGYHDQLKAAVTAEDGVVNSTGPVSDADEYTVDNQSPGIVSSTFTTPYTEIEITFSEGVYSTDGGSGAAGTGDFTITFTDADSPGGSGATGASISSVNHTAGYDYAILTISYSGGDGEPDSDDTIEIKAKSSSLYDAPGNVMPSSSATSIVIDPSGP